MFQINIAFSRSMNKSLSVENDKHSWLRMDIGISILLGEMAVFYNHKYMVLYIYYLVWCWIVRIALSIICVWN
jgi:hypothetical protein